MEKPKHIYCYSFCHLPFNLPTKQNLSESLSKIPKSRHQLITDQTHKTVLYSGRRFALQNNVLALKRAVCFFSLINAYRSKAQALAGLSVFWGTRTAWMLGTAIPPWAMVTLDKSLFNTSSFWIANCKWRGMIRVSLSRAALLANSRTSAANYSMTAAK